MQRFINWFAWLVVAAVLALVMVNLPTLMIRAPLNLFAFSIDAPLGMVLIGLSALLAILFFVATLHNQVGSLRESNRLNKEVQRLQALVDQGQTAALDKLHESLKQEFVALNNRVDSLSGVSRQVSAGTNTEFRNDPYDSLRS